MRDPNSAFFRLPVGGEGSVDPAALSAAVNSAIEANGPTIRAAMADAAAEGAVLYGKTAEGNPLDVAMITPGVATVFSWLTQVQGLAEGALAAARSRLYEPLALTGDTALLALPSPGSPNLTLARVIETDRSFMLALAQPDAALNDVSLDLTFAVPNATGSPITMFIAPLPITGRAPVYLHGDHASALPIIEPGTTAYFRARWERGILVVQRLALTPNFRRMRPRLRDFLIYANSGNYSFPTGMQKAGDLILSLSPRSNSTPPNAATGFSNFAPAQAGAGDSSWSMRASYRITQADDEANTFGSNAGNRNLAVLIQDVDPVNPVVGVAAYATSPNTTLVMPALAVSEPCLFVPFFGAQSSLDAALTPFAFPTYGEVFAAHDHSSQTSSMYVGQAAGRMSVPAYNLPLKAGTSDAGGGVIALRGKELAA